MQNRRHMLLRTLLSAGSSALLLGLMFRLFHGGDDAVRPRLFEILRRTSATLAGGYVGFTLLQSIFRAWRYRVLVAADPVSRAPGLVRIALVTVVRNMLVDLLPGRVGELSYLAMMNRGYEVSGRTCVSSLAISFAFDFAALLLIVAAALTWQALSGPVEGWLASAALALLIVVAVGLLVLFVGLRIASAWARRLLGPWARRPWVARALEFLDETCASIDAVRRAGALGGALGLSLAVRLAKYAGLYALFQAVVRPSFPALAGATPAAIVSALLCAEGTASLPLPSFMSFGTYEAGGALALTLLGFSKADSLAAMLAIHLWSQLVDYSVGGLGFVLFTFTAGRRREASAPAGSRAVRFVYAAAVGLLLAGVAVLGLEFRRQRKLGALAPPPAGRAVPMTREEEGALRDAVRNLDGFVVWSSNRFGNHDILMLALPGLELRRLTRHPHVDSFPRISPDGTRIAFARSQTAWVSQRNPVPWDVYVLDIASGAERLAAPCGNAPTWSADGEAVYFQRNGDTFVERRLATGEERVLLRAGQGAVPAGVRLEAPVFSPRSGAVAATLRGRLRATVVLGLDGSLVRIGGGCQIDWGPDSGSVFYVDTGGRQKNAVYRVDAQSRERTMWLDLPGDYSHEYFPRMSNDGRYLALGASRGAHEHDTADYEIFLWRIGSPAERAIRLTHHTGNDCWPDLYLKAARP